MSAVDGRKLPKKFLVSFDITRLYEIQKVPKKIAPKN